MDSDIKGSLSEEECLELVAALKAELSWQWDGRFNTPLAHMPVGKKDPVGRILENYLGKPWDNRTIDSAPESVQRLVAPLGGVMSGQLFYAGGQKDDIVFCSWWPWNNGQTVSVRLGASREDSVMLAGLVSSDAR